MSKELTWEYEKFKDDMAIYAFCPVCGFMYNPSQKKPDSFETEIVNQYKYCPECGKYLYSDAEKVDVIWNERSHMDRWGITEE